MGMKSWGRMSSKKMNYEQMWDSLKAEIEQDLEFHESGSMQSIGEAVHGAEKCREILSYMKEIEKAHEKDFAD